MNTNNVDKQELMKNIVVTRNLVNEYIGIQKGIHRLANAKERLINFLVNYPIIVLISIVPAFIIDIFIVFRSVHISNIFTIFMFANIILSVLWLFIGRPIIRLIRKLNHKQNGPKIRELQAAAQKVILNLQSQSVIPSKYWNLYALNCFYGYLSNMQADSLKECVNIYERHLQHLESINALRGIQYGINGVQASVDSLKSTVNDRMF